MITDPETLYRQLGRLIEAMPDFTHAPLSSEGHRWLARAYALVEQVGNSADPNMFTLEVNRLGTAAWKNAVHHIQTIIYRAFAIAEMRAPAGASGAFIPVGGSFDAFAALSPQVRLKVRDAFLDHTVGRERNFDLLVLEPVVQEIGRILQTLKEERSTVLLVEQNIGLAALTCSRFYILRAGQIVHEDRGTTLKADAAELGRRYYL